MLLALKIFLRKLLIPLLYFGGIYLFIVTIFKNVSLGLNLLTFLAPQANIYYKLHSYPYGWMFIDLFILAVSMGILIQQKKSEKTGNEKWIWILIIFSYFTTWIASSNFNLPIPVSLSSQLFVDWKNYIRTFFLYFFVLRIAKEPEGRKILLLLMSVAVLIMALKSYRNFSGGSSFAWDKRYGGPFEVAGLGSNHFGTFMSAYSMVFLTLGLIETHKLRKYLFLATALFSLHPIFFAYSRGAYLGYAGALLLVGIVRVRILLVVLLVVGIAWQTILPESVVDRITMTKTDEGELEGSAAGRLELWEEAFELFESSPVVGVGFNGFANSVKGTQTIVAGGQKMTDTHSFFVRTLCEQGIIGLSIILIIFGKAFFSGLKLYRNSSDPFYLGLGLGFSACVISLFLSNLFGDRFSYLQSGCYFWALWGLVDSCNVNSSSSSPGKITEKKNIAVKSGVLGKFLYP